MKASFFRQYFIAIAFAALLSSGFAYACSCLTPNSIPEKIEATPVIFHGKVKKQLWRGIPFFSAKKTIFTVVKSYKGELGETVEVFHAAPLGGNCGTAFDRRFQGLVFAYVDDGDEFVTGSCAMNSGFTDHQFFEYFHNQFDTSELDVFCSWILEKAYSEEKKSGNFNVKDEECLKKKGVYDKLYRKAGAKH
ncbi:MAG: hypothetical protein ABJN69_16460 [Hellea sp.]